MAREFITAELSLRKIDGTDIFKFNVSITAKEAVSAWLAVLLPIVRRVFFVHLLLFCLYVCSSVSRITKKTR